MLTDCAALRREIDQAEASYQRVLKGGPERVGERTIALSYKTKALDGRQVGNGKSLCVFSQSFRSYV
ncbi:MAG: hypothetical protein ACO1SX_21905 [Actinomycetota bacterium]